MKNKLVKIVLIVLCIILVTGCKKDSDNELAGEVRLKSHPQIQYSWYWKYEEGSPNDVITFVESKFIPFGDVDEDAEEYEPHPDKEGYTGEQVYVVNGLKEGKTTVIFITYEPDGKTTHPKQVVKYEYTVDKDLKVKVKKVK